MTEEEYLEILKKEAEILTIKPQEKKCSCGNCKCKK